MPPYECFHAMLVADFADTPQCAYAITLFERFHAATRHTPRRRARFTPILFTHAIATLMTFEPAVEKSHWRCLPFAAYPDAILHYYA